MKVYIDFDHRVCFTDEHILTLFKDEFNDFLTTTFTAAELFFAEDEDKNSIINQFTAQLTTTYNISIKNISFGNSIYIDWEQEQIYTDDIEDFYEWLDTYYFASEIYKKPKKIVMEKYNVYLKTLEEWGVDENDSLGKLEK